MFKAVPAPRPITEDVVAECPPGAADDAEVEKRSAFALIPAAASRARLVVWRLA
jgi:hypothetical protein